MKGNDAFQKHETLENTNRLSGPIAAFFHRCDLTRTVSAHSKTTTNELATNII
jgi:hypothetical protein